MIIIKSINFKKFFQFTGHHIIWLISGSAIIAFLYKYEFLDFAIPWLPLSVIGTAVAFYVGFKNNQAYDRMWEARKIWGAIVNSSRTWGMYVDGFINNQFNSDIKSPDELAEIKKNLIYRHIAWLYALRSQLLIVAPWEHANQRGLVGFAAKRYQKKFGVGLVDDEVTRFGLEQFLPKEELTFLVESANTATQIINQQSRSLTELRKEDVLDDFRHMQMAQVLSDLYVEQGKCERIKKFPLPRQYAFMSRSFVTIFIFLLPFSLIPSLIELGNLGFWLSIPITALVGWVYVMMEVTGDYTENPFQGMANDIPMLSLCRTIEIDLRQMLEEDNLPPPIEAKNGILM